MLYYRGDKFVKGKKFTINESVYKFIKKTKDNELVFESIKDNSTLKILESEFTGVETLVEKINQENKEINELIGKILRSKGLARKNEELLAKHGIKVNYDQGQGVTLIGPNGKRLWSSTKEVEGPTKPGHSNTHEKPDAWYKERYESYKKYKAEAEEELTKLQAMDRDDIIRKYNDKTTDEALAAHEASIEKQKERITDYEKSVREYEDRFKREIDSAKRSKRAGHKGSARWSDKVMSKNKSNEKVDYLNYLTKADFGNPTKSRNADAYVGDRRQSSSSDEWYSSNYYGRHGKPGDRSERMNKYAELKNNISRAQSDVSWTSQDNGRYGGYKSEEALEAEIQKMRDDLEAKIEELRKNNDSKKSRNAEYIKKLEDREKELDDYLKSLGIRESVRAKMVEKAMIVESAKLAESNSFNEDYAELYGDTVDFTSLRRIVEVLRAIHETADNDGFKDTERLNKVINELSDITMSIEEFYNF